MSSEPTGYIKGYYVVMKATNSKKESRMARIRDWLLSLVARLLFRIRSRFSKIIINGRPLCKEPDDLPPDVRRLSIKQLKRIKEWLEGFEPPTDKVRISRPGYLAPPSSPRVCDDDLEIEVMYAGEEEAHEEHKADTPETPPQEYGAEVCYLADDERSTTPEDVPVHKPTPRRVRPKAARGPRPDMVIPPYVIIDETVVVPVNPRIRKKRPKAAKGERTRCVDHPIDLPAEMLLEQYRSEEKKVKVNSRPRPAAPVRRAKKPEALPLPVDEEDDLEAAIEEILRDVPSSTPKRQMEKEKQYGRRLGAVMRAGTTRRTQRTSSTCPTYPGRWRRRSRCGRRRSRHGRRRSKYRRGSRYRRRRSRHRRTRRSKYMRSRYRKRRSENRRRRSRHGRR